MSKYKLNFSELNSNSEVQYLEFSSAKKRAEFITDIVTWANPRRVFTLIIKDSENFEYSDIFVFENLLCMEKVIELRCKDFWLFEWKSYGDAYKCALDLKEGTLY